MNNGFAVKVNNILYGPYANYDDAVKSHVGQDNMLVLTLHETPHTFIVNNCDRPWCAHCQVEDSE